jgi:hypothetical protein
MVQFKLEVRQHVAGLCSRGLGLSLNVSTPIEVETTRHAILLIGPASANFASPLEERFIAIGASRSQSDTLDDHGA